MIMRASPRRDPSRPHLADRLGQAHENRLADDEMPDIEFHEFRHGRELFGRFEIEAMARMHFKPDGGPKRGASLKALEFRLAFAASPASTAWHQVPV